MNHRVGHGCHRAIITVRSFTCRHVACARASSHELRECQGCFAGELVPAPVDKQSMNEGLGRTGLVGDQGRAGSKGSSSQNSLAASRPHVLQILLQSWTKQRKRPKRHHYQSEKTAANSDTFLDLWTTGNYSAGDFWGPRFAAAHETYQPRISMG